jgi:predicted permease
MSLFRRVSNLFSRAQVEQEIEAELQSHIEMRSADNMAAGMSPLEARRDAMIRFGNSSVVKERVTAMDVALFLNDIWADVEFSFRQLRKNPGFAIAAILTLALGIGASTAVFSVVNAVLLRPLPYTDADRLVIGSMDLRVRNVHDLPFSSADFIDLRNGTKAFFQDFAGVFTGPALVPRGDGTSEQIHWAVATTNFFRVTGARVVLGRDFTEEDGIPQSPAPPPGAQPPETAPPPTVAILSYEYFQRRYGGDANVLGRTLRTTGGPGMVVVGVLPPRFRLYFPPEASVEIAPDVWIADRLSYDAANRLAFSIRPVGRLKDGAALEQARAAANHVAEEARKNFPVQRTAGYSIRLEPMQQHLVAEVRPAILALMGSGIFLLLIACANVANLLLVRASLRERELAMRAALGACVWRLIRPIIVEAFLLAAMGALFGLALAWAGIRELHVLAPANLPRLDGIRMDAFVLGFGALTGVATAVIFSLAPAWRASRPALINSLRSNTGNPGLAAGQRLRNLVVIVEVALSFMLLIGSGLMFRSFLQLQRVDPGFDAHGLFTFQALGVGAIGNTPEARANMVDAIERHLRAIPGVQSVTASYPFPLAGDFNAIRWGTADALSDSGKFQATDYQIVLPGYFEAMRTSLLAGRTFTENDNLAGRNHVIIDDLLAKKAFGGESAVGKRILVRIRTPEPEWVEVIGVVAHQHTTSLAERGREEVYFVDGFFGSGRVRSWAIRMAGDTAGDDNLVHRAIKEVNPNLVVNEMESGEALVDRAKDNTRFSLLLLAIFAAIAGLLAGVGLYGVLSTAVRQRASEIGVRMALGAGRQNIFALVVGHGLLLSALGISAGMIAALVLTRLMSTMLVGVKPGDPATFAGMTLGFLVISVLASYLPARRAAALDPMTSLREQ